MALGLGLILLSGIGAGFIVGANMSEDDKEDLKNIIRDKMEDLLHGKKQTYKGSVNYNDRHSENPNKYTYSDYSKHVSTQHDCAYDYSGRRLHESYVERMYDECNINGYQCTIIKNPAFETREEVMRYLNNLKELIQNPLGLNYTLGETSASDLMMFADHLRADGEQTQCDYAMDIYGWFNDDLLKLGEKDIVVSVSNQTGKPVLYIDFPKPHKLPPYIKNDNRR